MCVCVWCGVVWCGVVWCGVVWCGVVCCACVHVCTVMYIQVPAVGGGGGGGGVTLYLCIWQHGDIYRCEETVAHTTFLLNTG